MEIEMITRRSMIMALAGTITAQQRQNGLLTMSKFPGGPMKTRLTPNIAVNQNSSLDRVWYTINDAECPVQLTDGGVATVYESERYGGKYLLLPRGAVKANRPVKAFSLTFALFNVWGERTRLLGYTQVLDMAAGSQHTMESGWSTNENEVTVLRYSVAFVNRVLSEDETVWNCDYAGVARKLAEAKIIISAGKLAIAPPVSEQ